MEKRREALQKRVATYIEEADDFALLEMAQLINSQKPEWQPVVSSMPVDEIQERFSIIVDLEKYWKYNFTYLTTKPIEEFVPFGNYQVASLMWLDIADLRTIRRVWSATAVLNAIFKMPALLKICK
jgi:hypothetical protein